MLARNSPDRDLDYDEYRTSLIFTMSMFIRILGNPTVRFYAPLRMVRAKAARSSASTS